MSIEDRTKLYSKIEELRGRPLIVYATSINTVHGGQMSLDAIPELCEQIRRIPGDRKFVDLMLISQGGDPIVAWRIISLLRERFDGVDVLVPYSAQSAATVLSFGADNIVMHPFSCLGPIDSQIIIQSENNTLKVFSTEDITSFMEYIRDDCSGESSKQIAPGTKALEYLISELRPTELGMVKKSMKMSKTLAEKLLSLHMGDKDKIDEIQKKFSSLTHHGYTVGRKEAKESGLPVICPDGKLEDLMWSVWLDLENEMHCNAPLDPMNILVNDQEFKRSFKQSVEKKSTFFSQVSVSHPVAVIESTGLSSCFESTVNITATRDDLNIKLGVTSSSIGWKRKVLSEK